MDNIIDLIATDASPADISDAIKGVLYAKASERIDVARPIVAASLFGEEGDQEIDQDSQEEE